MNTLNCRVGGADAPCMQIEIERLVIVGWARRDKLEVENHIQEVEAFGVAWPQTIPFLLDPRLRHGYAAMLAERTL
jgi:hypothetical protein